LQRGLHVTGTVGVLVQARGRGLVRAVVPLLDQLRTELGFYLADDLIEEVRRECGE
jgi:predicted nucleic acid-binding protein